MVQPRCSAAACGFAEQKRVEMIAARQEVLALGSSLSGFDWRDPSNFRSCPWVEQMFTFGDQASALLTGLLLLFPVSLSF